MLPTNIDGYPVLAVARVPNRAGSGMVDRCVVLLALTGDVDGTPIIKEYVACLWNDHDGSRYWGDYHQDYNDAVLAFAEKVKNHCRE